MIDDVKKAMEGLLEPKIVETDTGKAEVRQLFSISRLGMIAGCSVLEGKVTRNALVRVLRNGDTLFTGKLLSLKRFKDDAKEVASGYECGISIDGFNDMREGDILSSIFEEKENKPSDG
jgi:translation initiation factor IF-2